MDPASSQEKNQDAAEDGRVVAVDVVRNPDKLRHVAGTLR